VAVDSGSKAAGIKQPGSSLLKSFSARYNSFIPRKENTHCEDS
jgi:hypothetical protein